ncbi:MAG TPA: rRNA maturation RNase YbeY [Bacteroidia bacterium]|nr:rRNA maturation RNase YbeY [Bacteroidia bacterium]
MPVTFQNQQIAFVLKDKPGLKAWIEKVITRETKKLGQLNFVFTSDEEILKSNIHFLKHNTYTDIITFDYCEGNTINGDILISVERVKENAGKFGVHTDEELRRVMIHGVLHLCGYKDKSKKDSERMRKKENDSLKLL